MKKKQIFILANGRLDSYKAYTQNFLSLSKIANIGGYKVTLSGLTKSNISFLDNFADKEIIIKKSKWGILRLLLKNLFELLSKDYDIIVFGSIYTWMFPFYYLTLKINIPKKIIYYMQDPVPETHILMNLKTYKSLKNRFFYQIALICERLMFNISNIILLPGKGYLKTINKRRKLDIKTILVSYNTWGIQKHFETKISEYVKKHVINTFNIKRKFPIILYSGKIQRWIRGLEMQLRALKRIVGLYPDALLIITGSGDDEWIINYAKDLGIIDNIVLTGKVTDEELKVIYNISDIMIFPTIDYLLPTKFFESILMNVIPIVWNKSEDMVNILGDSSITYEESDESLSNALIHTINNIEIYKDKINQLCSVVKNYHKKSKKSFIQALSIKGDYQ